MEWVAKVAYKGEEKGNGSGVNDVYRWSEL